MSDAGPRVHYEFAGFRLDTQQRLLTSGAERQPVPLQPKVFDTLLYFVERRGELLDKSTLMKAVWPNVVVEENSLNQNVSVLRRALGENPGEHRFIVTEPGRGYRFVAEVRVVAQSPQVAAPQGTAPKKSVAVLPFANLTGDPGKEYFGDGIAEELIHKLARTPGLRIPARTSSFAYKGRNVDVRQIARDLDVAVILEGSVRSAGERLRITAQMVDGQDGFHIWSHSYDRKFEDIFELQDEIAQAIVDALRITLDGANPAVGQPPPTRSLEAYHLYLQATARHSAAGGPGNIAAAFSMYQRAMELDPGFARAYSQSASLRSIASVLNVKLPGSLVDAELEASKALSLDPTLGGALAALGIVSALQGKWLEAERRFQNAFSADEADAASRDSYAMLVLASAGHLRRYHESALATQRLAPAWVPVLLNVTVSSALVGRDAAALAHAQLARKLGMSLRVGPLPDILATLAMRAGQVDQAIEVQIEGLAPDALEMGGADVVRLVFQAIGDPAQRDAAVRELDRLRAHFSGAAFFEIFNRRLLYWYVQLGALDRAYEALDHSLERFASLGMIGPAWSFFWMREMAAFRRDDRFQRIVGRFGLMPYWQRFGPPDGCELRGDRLVCS